LGVEIGLSVGLVWDYEEILSPNKWLKIMMYATT